MKKITIVFFVSLLVTIPTLAGAQEARQHDLKVGYVNLDRILQSFEPYRNAIEDLSEYRNKLQEQIATNRKEIQQLRKELEEGGQYLSQEAAEKKQQELRRRMQMFQQSRQKSQEMMNKREQEELAPVRRQVQIAVKSVAEENGYDVIHRFGGNQASSILWVASDVDLSDKVIERLENNPPAVDDVETDTDVSPPEMGPVSP